MKKGFTVVELFFAIGMILMVASLCLIWPWNLYQLTQCDFEAPYKAEILRGIGVLSGPMAIFIVIIDLISPLGK